MNISYTVRRSRKRQKTMSLQVCDDAKIIVSVPAFTPADDIKRFVEQKQGWLVKILARQKQEAAQAKEKKYETGEHFFYLGQRYPLEVFFEPFEKEGIVFRNNRFYLNCRSDKALRKHYFISWYKQKADELIRRRVDFFSRMLKLRYEKIRITSAESRWGSCSEDNILAFSYRLIMAPPDVMDYVIVHELMHIREKNHSSRFWKKVEECIPSFREHRRRLNHNRRNFAL
ncbi:MAG: M48 family metallopeptidase [Syntrophaceae bacterium]|nr:M48 family metallopeptidase [Syntrophaceae bacterium]